MSLVRSVGGNARIPKSDKALSKAGAQVAALFRKSADRPEGPVRRGQRTPPIQAVTRRQRD